MVHIMLNSPTLTKSMLGVPGICWEGSDDESMSEGDDLTQSEAGEGGMLITPPGVGMLITPPDVPPTVPQQSSDHGTPGNMPENDMPPDTNNSDTYASALVAIDTRAQVRPALTTVPHVARLLARESVATTYSLLATSPVVQPTLASTFSSGAELLQPDDVPGSPEHASQLSNRSCMSKNLSSEPRD
ncbi:hypothetical protein RSAG8_10974, partial [Rhizoctonia solani AG-8 WAC10335]